jgi:hypothetical protein
MSAAEVRRSCCFSWACAWVMGRYHEGRAGNMDWCLHVEFQVGDGMFTGADAGEGEGVVTSFV